MNKNSCSLSRWEDYVIGLMSGVLTIMIGYLAWGDRMREIILPVLLLWGASYLLIAVGYFIAKALIIITMAAGQHLVKLLLVAPRTS
jgi:hypothetical protein